MRKNYMYGIGSLAVFTGIFGGLNAAEYMTIDLINEKLFSFWKPATLKSRIAKIAVSGGIGVAVKTALGIAGYGLFGIPAIGGIAGSLVIRLAVKAVVESESRRRAHNAAVHAARRANERFLTVAETVSRYPELFQGEIFTVNGEQYLFNGNGFAQIR